MGAKRNRLRKIAQRLVGTPASRAPLEIEVLVGEAGFRFALDESRAAQIARLWWRSRDGENVRFNIPGQRQRLLPSLQVLDLSVLGEQGRLPPFLVFDLADRFSGLDPKCAFIVRTKAASQADDEEQSYRVSLVNPRPVLVAVPEDLERISFAVRIAGSGVLPRIGVKLGVPGNLGLLEARARALAETRVARRSGAAAEPWPLQLKAPERDMAIMASLAAHAGALSAQLQALTTQIAIVERQAEDFGATMDGSGGLSDAMEGFVQRLDRSMAAAGLAEATLASAVHRLRALIGADTEAGMAIDMQPYRRKRSGDAWRREIIDDAIGIALEHGLYLGLAHLWRQIEGVEFKLVLDEFAEAISRRSPEIARQCVVLALAFDSSEHRVRHAAARLFRWGNLADAGQLIERVEEEADTAFIGELKLALELKKNVRALVPPRPARHGFPGSRRIAYVASSALPFVVSGYTARTHELLSGLAALGQEVGCYTRPGFPWDRPRVLPENDAVPESVRVGAVEYLHTPTRPVEAAAAAYMRQAAAALVDRLRANPPAVVHAASNYRNGLPALIAARTLGVPFIYEVRGLWELTAASRVEGWETTERFAYEREMERFLVDEADVVLTITEAVRDELFPGNFDRSHVQLLSNAVDPERFRPAPRDDLLAATLDLAPDDLVLVYAGSLVEYEGLDDVVAAVGLLRERDVPAKLIIVGDGRARSRLMAQVAALGLEESVAFIGRVAREEVRDYLALADIVPIVRKRVRVCELVSPLKPFEAMAMEKVVVVSGLHALQEIVEDGVRGRICRAEDPAHLAEVIAELHADPAAREAMGRAARVWVIESHSWAAHARRLAAIYEGLREKCDAATDRAARRIS